MSHWLIATIGIAYIGIAFDQWLKGGNGVALMFVGYAIAQAGVWMQAK
jgi:hypothetical protein